MGEIAEGIIAGEICQYCCIALDEVRGFPSSCDECGGEEEDLHDQAEAVFTMLGKKANRRLELIRLLTDRPAGSSPGDVYCFATSQNKKLIRHGYAMTYRPKDSPNAIRIVVTDRGKEYLRHLKDTGGPA